MRNLVVTARYWLWTVALLVTTAIAFADGALD